MTMKTILKIQGSYMSKYNNALHTEFHLNMLSKVQTVDLSKINIPQVLIDEWKKNTDLEVETNRHARASVETQEQIQVDTDRDNTLSYIFGIIHNAQRSPVAEHRAAYAHIEPLIRPYKGIQHEAYDQETLYIRSLVRDLRKSPTDSFITTLGLTDAVSTLETLNEKYATLRSQRSDTRVATAVETSKKLRPKTDECYNQVCSLIYSSQLTTTDPATTEEITTLIRQMNQIIAEFKASYHQSIAKKDGKTKNEI